MLLLFSGAFDCKLFNAVAHATESEIWGSTTLTAQRLDYTVAIACSLQHECHLSRLSPVDGVIAGFQKNIVFTAFDLSGRTNYDYVNSSHIIKKVLHSLSDCGSFNCYSDHMPG